ncbi:MAG: sn-glycerol-1-phosphate dehydrogenase [Firmicutes bacterium]|nr:sn-glycerol-1-phosphate dehydrogenase [Bacillota bacterium]
MSMQDLIRRINAVKCSCGREHRQDIEVVSVGNTALADLAEYLEHQDWKSLAVIADANTAEVGKGAICHYLPKTLDIQWIQLETPSDKPLVPDEGAVGRILMEIPPDCQVMVALGAGTINDLVRFVSARIGLPFISVPTAPSMDGYASSVAPLHLGNFKKTFSAHAPRAIFADSGILATAPAHMVAAGFGDIVGKVTARFDWQMSHTITGEYYCTYPQELMDEAVRACLSGAKEVGEGSPKLLEALTEALILSGIAIMLTGNSRPASGPEHLLAHYWEVQAGLQGKEDALHGAKVGVATPICLAFIKKLFALSEAELRPIYTINPGLREQKVREEYQGVSEQVISEAQAKWFAPESLRQLQQNAVKHWSQLQRLAEQLPQPQKMIKQLRVVKGPAFVDEIGISREELYRALLFSREMRSRFTVFDLAGCMGVLEEIAEQVAEEYAG